MIGCDADLDTLLTGLYVEIDDQVIPSGRHGRGQPKRLSDAELVGTAVAQVLLIVTAVTLPAGPGEAVRAGLAAPAGSAPQGSAVFLAAGVDGAEGGCGEGGEHARVGGGGGGDAFAAAQSGADELVGVGAVDLRARWAAGGAAGLAGDGQDPAGFVDGGVAVQQFAGGAVDAVDAAAQQDGLQAPAGVPGCACGDGAVGNGGTPLVGALAGGGGRAEASRRQARK